MRNDSCRKCGAETEIKQRCSVCKDGVTSICKKCHFETEEQIHFQCSILDMNFKLPVSRVA